jgi:pyruvate,orthophosphate dikinase
MGKDSGAGVAMTRNASTGEPEPEGDFLLNAQGEDVVAGARRTLPVSELRLQMPTIYSEFLEISRRLEARYGNMQDMEFTIERGKLWILQTRDGKRTAQAEVKIAADMVREGLISREEAVRRVQPEQVDFFLHPQLDPNAAEQNPAIAKGLNVSPGAAVGVVSFDADTTERWVEEGRNPVIMVRPETKPDDVHGMLAAEGVLTAHGGRTSHAALVARQFGKPAVVGVTSLEIDLDGREMKIGGESVKEGEWISIDGTNGNIHLGKLDTVVPDLRNANLIKILGWADEIRRLDVRANADYPVDAERAREYGAQGIGLCRTEHMFFETDRAADDPRPNGHRAERSHLRAAAAPAKRLQRALPRHGGPARDHSTDRPAAPRVPARPRPIDSGPRRSQDAPPALPHHERDRRRA